MVSLYAAQIECPGGANGYVSDFNNGKGRARENLAKSVGPMICSGCHLSTMTRLDYLEVQKQEADAEIALLKKRQQRQELQAAIEERVAQAQGGQPTADADAAPGPQDAAPADGPPTLDGPVADAPLIQPDQG